MIVFGAENDREGVAAARRVGVTCFEIRSKDDGKKGAAEKIFCRSLESLGKKTGRVSEKIFRCF